MKSRVANRGESRSLLNDDIAGARPKEYGVGNSSIRNAFAGVRSGIQERNKESTAPWGMGGNFDSTRYGQKWIDKTEK